MKDRKFRYFVPTSASDSTPIEITKTESEIIKEFWPRWSKSMLEKGLYPTYEQCIEDWVVVNWAEEIE